MNRSPPAQPAFFVLQAGYDVSGLTTCRSLSLNANPYEAPVAEVGAKSERHRFLVAVLRVISGLICVVPTVLAGYAWCRHFYMDYTGGYATNSFSWYKLAIDLTWIAGACFAFVAIGWGMWWIATYVTRNSPNAKTRLNTGGTSDATYSRYILPRSLAMP